MAVVYFTPLAQVALTGGTDVRRSPRLAGSEAGPSAAAGLEDNENGRPVPKVNI